jgi:hypothetical protein
MEYNEPENDYYESDSDKMENDDFLADLSSDKFVSCPEMVIVKKILARYVMAFEVAQIKTQDQQEERRNNCNRLRYTVHTHAHTHTHTHTRTYVLNIPIEVTLFICFNSILNGSFPQNSKSIISTITFTLLSHFN